MFHFQNFDHESALHSAAQYGHTEIVKLLLEVKLLLKSCTTGCHKSSYILFKVVEVIRVEKLWKWQIYYTHTSLYDEQAILSGSLKLHDVPCVRNCVNWVLPKWFCSASDGLW